MTDEAISPLRRRMIALTLLSRAPRLDAPPSLGHASW